jgi:ABC-type multidrug transport system permease subunit
MVPGVMVSIIFSLSIGVTGLMFVTEKKDGLLDRSWVAGMTTVEVMIGHVLAKLFVLIFQIFVLLMMASYAFDVS